MKPTITTLQGTRIALPASTTRAWKGSAVLITQTTPDTMVIKRLVATPSWEALLPKLRALGKRIPRTTIARAIRTARQQMYGKTS